MTQPTHRLVAISKDDSKNRNYKAQFEVGACWPSKLDGALNMKIGGNRDFDEVYLVVVKGGQKTKVSTDTHFFTFWENSNRSSKNRDGEDMPEDDDDI